MSTRENIRLIARSPYNNTILGVSLISNGNVLDLAIAW